MATLCLVSALAVPIFYSANATNIDERHQKLTSLLRATSVPNRKMLLNSVLSKNIFDMVKPEAKQLHEILEVKFHPLSICQRIAPLLKSFSKSPALSGYVKPLNHIVLTRLFQQLAQVYSNVKMSFVLKLTEPSLIKCDAQMLEKFVMNGCRKGEWNIKINHQTKSLYFHGNLSLASKVAESSIDYLDRHLSVFGKNLTNTLKMISYKETCQQVEDQLANAQKNLEEEKRQVQFHKALIQKRKELKEQRIALEETERQKRLAQEAVVENARQEERKKQIEAERLVQHKKDIERQEAQKLAEKIIKQLEEKNAKFDKKVDNLTQKLLEMDTDSLRKYQKEFSEKEQQEMQEKSIRLCKMADHLERACRKTEISLLLESFEEQKRQHLEAYTESKKSKLENAMETHKQSMANKERVAKMMDAYEIFLATLNESGQEEYERQCAEAQEKLEAAKQQRIAEYTAQQEAEEQKRQQEELLERQRKQDELNRQQEQRLEEQNRQEEHKRREEKIAELERFLKNDSGNDRRTLSCKRSEMRWWKIDQRRRPRMRGDPELLRRLQNRHGDALQFKSRFWMPMDSPRWDGGSARN
jgi:translation initiation factor 3 subunit A